MKVVYVNTESEKDSRGSVEVMDIEMELEVYYDLLHCSTIDIVVRKIDGKSYAIICDDEATFVPMPKVSAVSRSMDMQMYGSLIVCALNERRYTDEGDDYRDLTDSEVMSILRRGAVGTTRSYPQGLRMIVMD